MKSHNSKIKLINHPFCPANQKGFTLLEVLVAMLAVTLFVAFSLEGMVLASLAQIRAREKAEASLFIQQNLEEIKVIAANYNPADLRTRCKAANINAGLAAGVAAQIPAPDASVHSSASNRDYPLVRTITPIRRNLLGIRYTITDPRNPNILPLAQLYTEVIPNAALQCPNWP